MSTLSQIISRKRKTTSTENGEPLRSIPMRLIGGCAQYGLCFWSLLRTQHPQHPRHTRVQERPRQLCYVINSNLAKAPSLPYHAPHELSPSIAEYVSADFSIRPSSVHFSQLNWSSRLKGSSPSPSASLSLIGITVEFFAGNIEFFRDKIINSFATGALASVCNTYIGKIAPLALRWILEVSDVLTACQLRNLTFETNA